MVEGQTELHVKIGLLDEKITLPPTSPLPSNASCNESYSIVHLPLPHTHRYASTQYKREQENIYKAISSSRKTRRPLLPLQNQSVDSQVYLVGIDDDSGLRESLGLGRQTVAYVCLQGGRKLPSDAPRLSIPNRINQTDYRRHILDEEGIDVMEGPDNFFASYGAEGLDGGPVGATSFGSRGGDGLQKAGHSSSNQLDDLPDMLLNVADIDSGIFFNDPPIWLGKGVGGSNDFEPGGLEGGLGMDPPEPPGGYGDAMEGTVDGGDATIFQKQTSTAGKGGEGQQQQQRQGDEGGNTFASSPASFPAPPLTKPQKGGSSSASGNGNGGTVLYSSMQSSMQSGETGSSLNGGGLMDETCSTISSDASTIWGMDMDPPGSAWRMGGPITGAFNEKGGFVPGATASKRKQDRNAREQKRSLKISQQIGHLKEVLESDGRKVKSSKMAILLSVENYIRELEGQISELTLNRQGGGGNAASMTNGMSGGGEATRSDSSSSSGSSSQCHQSDSQSGSSGSGPENEVAGGVGYKSLFKQVSTPLAVASTDGRFVDANMRFEMATGYTKEELSKLTFFNLVSPDELQETFTTVARMINHPGGETKFTRKAVQKQSRCPLYITISLVRQNAVPQFFQCSLH